MILQVHDELNFSVYPEEKERVQQIVIEEMERAYTMQVPLEADYGWGRNWLEAHWETGKRCLQVLKPSAAKRETTAQRTENHLPQNEKSFAWDWKIVWRRTKKISHIADLFLILHLIK